MKFNYKSRNGFTLIELLVVIGILAVLAAIAIPSIAGLIDRANVSADKTNANEYTNAIERFASEYELYCQDIASGTIDFNNLDAAQGRVYNVTKARTRGDIEKLESDEGLDGKFINRDTKMPQDVITTKSIINNYTKTSTNSFFPKESDAYYWYSPDCGVVVVASNEANKEILNSMVVSGMDAKGKDLSVATEWILLSDDTTSAKHDIEIAENGKYYRNVFTLHPSDYSGATEILSQGDIFPIPQEGDVYVYGDYEYRYGYHYNRYNNGQGYTRTENFIGWSVRVLDDSKSNYGVILNSIGGKPVRQLSSAFYGCDKLTIAPQLPKTTVSLFSAFNGCSLLEASPKIPTEVISLHATFEICVNLQYVSEIPKSATNLQRTFLGCKMLSGDIIVKSSIAQGGYVNCFSGTEKPIYIIADTTTTNYLVSTSSKNNVFAK